MKTATLLFCFFIIALRSVNADEADPDILADNNDEDPKEKTGNIGSELALMDSDSSEDSSDPANSDGELVIRAKRYCGYGGCCGGCMNCNCATMAPATYGPCGCCGCGYG